MTLSKEERAARDRASWAKSRARTGNWSSRAYNLAIQDAARYVRDNEPDLWQTFYSRRSAEQRARVEAAAISACTHDEIEAVAVPLHSLICTDCHTLLGVTSGAAPDGYQVFTGDGGRVAFRRVTLE